MKKLRGSFLLVICLFMTQILFSQENCSNGIDDDSDGLIDLNDTSECACAGINGGGGPIPSMIPNPSFESTNCCPSTYSQVNCATDWIQASDPTSDYMNNCGFVFGAASAAGLLPFPDGDGILGTIFSPGWQEYVGACLSTPMIAGTSYTIQFDIASTPIDGNGEECNNGIIDFGPIDITLFGAPSCAELPFPGVGCPIGYSGWDVLSTVNYTPQDNWSVVTLTFTPTVNINSIIIGSPCTLPADYQAPASGCYPYFYYDNLVLNNSNYFSGISITPSGGLCSNDAMLTASVDTTGGSWQWYDEGVALVGETDSILDVSSNGSGTGNYTAVYTIGSECVGGAYTFTSPNSPIPDFTFNQNCVGTVNAFFNTSTIGSGTITDFLWNFGDNGTSTLEDPTHLYANAGSYPVTLIVTSDQGCADSITKTIEVFPIPIANFSSSLSCEGFATVFTDQTSIPTPYTIDSYLWTFNLVDTSSAQNPSYLFPEAGTYPVSLIVVSNVGCIDTVSTNVIVCNDLIVPNVFSPNGDSENEFFLIDGLTGIDNKLVIYNRWGQIVYENNNYQNNWDGSGVADGTYYYLFYSNQDISFSGYVTVLR